MKRRSHLFKTVAGVLGSAAVLGPLIHLGMSAFSPTQKDVERDLTHDFLAKISREAWERKRLVEAASLPGGVDFSV
jgi:hypothetical protein